MHSVCGLGTYNHMRLICVYNLTWQWTNFICNGWWLAIFIMLSGVWLLRAKNLVIVINLPNTIVPFALANGWVDMLAAYYFIKNFYTPFCIYEFLVCYSIKSNCMILLSILKKLFENFDNYKTYNSLILLCCLIL